MKLTGFRIDNFLRVAGLMIILGLLVEIVSLGWVHPLAFALFAFVGASLIGLGVVIYLASLVFASGTAQGSDSAR